MLADLQAERAQWQDIMEVRGGLIRSRWQGTFGQRVDHPETGERGIIYEVHGPQEYVWAMCKDESGNPYVVVKRRDEEGLVISARVDRKTAYDIHCDDLPFSAPLPNKLGGILEG